jgi:hypothetical protein
MSDGTALSFTEHERMVMAEVALRLMPALKPLAVKWASTIPLDAPSYKLRGMRKTLEEMNATVLCGFLEELWKNGPEGSLQYCSQFLEELIRGQLNEPERQRATIAHLFGAARAVRLLIADALPQLLANRQEQDLIPVQLAFTKLWAEAAEALALIYSRLREMHFRDLV